MPLLRVRDSFRFDEFDRVENDQAEALRRKIFGPLDLAQFRIGHERREHAALLRRMQDTGQLQDVMLARGLRHLRVETDRIVAADFGRVGLDQANVFVILRRQNQRLGLERLGAKFQPVGGIRLQRNRQAREAKYLDAVLVRRGGGELHQLGRARLLAAGKKDQILPGRNDDRKWRVRRRVFVLGRESLVNRHHDPFHLRNDRAGQLLLERQQRFLGVGRHRGQNDEQ